MSSANNHKRNTLEGEFQRRMHDAEASPAPDLWARIDHELTVQENTDYKKRVLFYRQLAAACFVLFALTGSLLGYYYSNESVQHQPGMAASGSVPATGNPGGSAPAGEPEQSETETGNAAAVASAPAGRTARPGQEPQRHGSPTKANRPAAGTGEAQTTESASGYYYASQLPYSNAGDQPLSGLTKAFAGSLVNEAADSRQWAAASPFSGRYSSSASQRITVTFGSGSNMGQQSLMPQGTGALASQSRSFLEMTEQYKAAHDQYKQQQAQALASSLSKEDGKKQEQQAAKGAADSRWSLSLAYAPTYFDQNIGLPDQMMASVNRQSFSDQGPATSLESAYNMDAARDEFENKTEPAFSYTMEVKTGFKLKEKLKLLTGIGYSESSARTKSNYIVRQFWFKPRTNERYELNPSTIFLPSLNNSFTPDSIIVARTGDSFDVEYKYRHLSIPVGLQYEQDIARDWFLYASGGVAANFLIETSISSSNNDVQSVSYSPRDEDSPFRKMQFSGNLALGVGKRVSDNLTVVIGPEVRNYFSTLVAEPEKAMAPQGRPYAFGLSMGLNYQLGNGRR